MKWKVLIVFLILMQLSCFQKKQEVKVVENNNKIIIKIKNYKYNYNI